MLVNRQGIASRQAGPLGAWTTYIRFLLHAQVKFRYPGQCVSTPDLLVLKDLSSDKHLTKTLVGESPSEAVCKPEAIKRIGADEGVADPSGAYNFLNRKMGHYFV